MTDQSLPSLEQMLQALSPEQRRSFVESIESLVTGAMRRESAQTAEVVARLSSSTCSPEQESILERLHSLSAGSTGEQQADVFDSLCSQVALLYPCDDERSDAQILADPITPHLARYALQSLARYGLKMSTQAQRPTAKQLGQALLANNRPGAPGLTANAGRRASDAGHDAYRLARNGGASVAVAERLAIDAGYDAVRSGVPTEQNDRDKKALKRQIRSILVRDVFEPGGEAQG